MAWLFVFLTFATLVLVMFLLVAFWLYPEYSRTPEKRWHDRVMNARRRAFALASSERAHCQKLARQFESDSQSIRAAALQSYLARMPTDELEGFPGIGPATISKLMEAGYNSVATLRGARINIQGFGPKRIADLNNAVNGLVQRAGAHSETATNNKLAEMKAQIDEDVARCQARLNAAQAVIDRLSKLVSMAREITFARYLSRRGEQLVPAEWLNIAIPDLDRTVENADNKLRLAVERERAFLATRPEPPSRPLPVASPAKSSVVREKEPEPKTPETQSRESTSMECTVQLLYAAARADGRIAPKEREVIEYFVGHRFGKDAASANLAKSFCAHYESAAIDVDTCLRKVADLFVLEQRSLLLDVVYDIVSVSGGINDREQQLLAKVSRQLGVPLRPSANVVVTDVQKAETKEDASEDPGRTRDPCLAILGIEPSVPLSSDLVRRQYNLLRERYAEDKFQAMGPEFVVMARRKVASLQAAAEALLEPLGEKLEPVTADKGEPELRHNPELDAVFGA